jgi:hypothetical protein
MNLSRRKIIAAAATAAVGIVIAAPWLRRLKGRLLWAWHTTGPPDASPPDRLVLRRVAVFTGSLFGRTLAEDDLTDLVDRLTFAAQADASWRREYTILADYADALARSAGATSFADAGSGQRERVLARIMGPPVDDRRSALVALVSASERARRLFRHSTLGHLANLYGRSGVPWRQRGYARWPGIGGDAREYTRPGQPSRC